MVPLMIKQLKAICDKRGLTLQQAADQIGVSRGQLWRISQGNALGSRATWDKIIKWSGGTITPNTLMEAQIDAARKS